MNRLFLFAKTGWHGNPPLHSILNASVGEGLCALPPNYHQYFSTSTIMISSPIFFMYFHGITIPFTEPNIFTFDRPGTIIDAIFPVSSSISRSYTNPSFSPSHRFTTSLHLKSPARNINITSKLFCRELLSESLS